jgi:hypothetical protein
MRLSPLCLFLLQRAIVAHSFLSPYIFINRNNARNVEMKILDECMFHVRMRVGYEESTIEFGHKECGRNSSFQKCLGHLYLENTKK